jgi:hypothetical protein
MTDVVVGGLTAWLAAHWLGRLLVVLLASPR